MRETRKNFREVARDLGVSERTLRRWRNEGVTPSAPKAAAVETLKRVSTTVRRRKLAQARREGLDLSTVDVPPSVRRITRIDPYDPERKRRILSDTLELSIAPRARTSWGDILSRYRDEQNARRERAAFRGLVMMHGTFESEGVTRRGGPTMTEWEEINDWNDEEIEEWIEQALEDGSILGLRILRSGGSVKTTGTRSKNQPIGQKTRAPLVAPTRSKRQRSKTVRKK